MLGSGSGLTKTADVTIGDYEPRLKIECLAASKKVDSEDKVVRIHIENRANVLGIGLFVVVLLGLLTGLVIFGIRLSKK